MTIQRRTLLTGLAGILVSGFAPAAVGSRVLMPVKNLLTLEDRQNLFWEDWLASLNSGEVYRIFFSRDKQGFEKVMSSYKQKAFLVGLGPCFGVYA